MSQPNPLVPSADWNRQPFSYISRFGTEFRAARCDFVGGVRVMFATDPRLTLSDAAEMIGYHAVNIRPLLLDGFSGYDNIDFRFD